MRSIRSTSLILLFISIAACNNSPTVPPASNTTDTEEVEAIQPPVVDADIKNWEEIQSWVAGQKGKVVVVDVWSTSCIPCIKELPNFVALHEELAGEIACASVNIDFYGAENETPGDLKPSVVKLLTSKRATMQNFISSDADEDIYEHISIASIPAVLVYDRAGKLHTTFNNDEALYGPEGFNYADNIRPLVQQLLNELEEDLIQHLRWSVSEGHAVK